MLERPTHAFMILLALIAGVFIVVTDEIDNAERTGVESPIYRPRNAKQPIHKQQSGETYAEQQ